MGILVVESPDQQRVGFESLISKVLISPKDTQMEVEVYFDL